MTEKTSTTRALHRRALFALAAAAALLLAAPSLAGATVRPATPATFRSVFSAAAPGDVITLAAGDYGTFTGARKPGQVTIEPQAGAAASLGVNFSNASNITISGVTVAGATISGTSSNIAIVGSRFTKAAVVRADQMINANILFDGDSFAGINVCGSCYEGRLQVAGQSSGPAGVTVQNSRFGPGGDADGIQTGGWGVKILHNEFVGIRQVDAVHTDSLQLYGQRNTVIVGNYFHDDDVDIMAPDGGDHEQITDNVFVGDGDYKPAVQLGSQDTTAFVHNTMVDIDVHMDKKPESSDPSHDGVVRDNIFVNGGLLADPPACVSCVVSYNLFDRRSNADGSNVEIGTPRFVGGASPASYAGFQLAAGSPGKGDASDGADRGARIVAPAAPPPPAGSSPARPSVKATLRLPKRIRWSRLRRGLNIQVRAQEPVRLSFRLARRHAHRALATKRARMPGGRRTFVLHPSRRRLGHRRAQRLVLTVTMRNGAGATRHLRRTIRVVR